MGAFGGLPFVAGSVFGHRVWVENSGELISPVQGYRWRTGEMEAECYTSDSRASEIFNRYLKDLLPEGAVYINSEQWTLEFVSGSTLPKQDGCVGWDRESTEIRDATGEIINTWYTIRGWKFLSAEESRLFENCYRAAIKELEERPPLPHLDKCSCGFYAYYRGRRNSYTGEKENVSGVIEGYGETVVGTLGFRSRKARIVALAPSRSVKKRAEKVALRNRLALKHPEIPFFMSERKMYKAFPTTTRRRVMR